MGPFESVIQWRAIYVHSGTKETRVHTIRMKYGLVLKTDVLQDCALAVAGGHVSVISTLIIDLSLHVAQHALVL